MTARLEHVDMTEPTRLQRDARHAAWAAARARFSARPVAEDWLATHRDVDRALNLLGRPPFVMANTGSERGRLRGVRLALGWLANQPGDTWQQRWQVSGAEAAGSDWKQGCVPWLDDHGVHARQRLDLLSIGVISMICADLVRPSLRWLAAPGVSAWALARNLRAGRDPDGFAGLHAACQDDPQVTPSARQRPWAGPPSSSPPRAAH